MRRTAGAALAAAACLAAAVVATGTSATSNLTYTGVSSANQKATGIVAPNVLTPELDEHVVAQGATPLENGTSDVPYYGYDGNGPMVPPAGSTTEASKTEPDKNTYLVLDGQTGADPSYDYGTHFLFQGHETGTPGYLTRINLDADAAHRVTLLATNDSTGAALPNFDGSTWDPWAQRLLFTSEGSLGGGVWQATLNVPSRVDPLTGILGQGGFEGVQNDSKGNVYIVEDAGGAPGVLNPHAKQPNSFLFRFVPADKTDLTQGGVLQALQVQSLAHPGPIVFHAGQVDADITSQDTKDLNTYGKVFTTRWITVHDTSVDGTAPFSANQAAKDRGATPFKRPENGVFRPGTGFTQFFFDATGDTNALSEANADFGGWGAIFRLTQSPSANTGKLRLFYESDEAHASFDNVNFLTRNSVVFVQDMGDTLHTQGNALDSAFLFDAGHDYRDNAQPVRLLAEGRDTSATLDSGYLGQPGFQNEGDNEITGFHVSNGDPSTGGILGSQDPRPFVSTDWRVFYTQQHGDNYTWEITRRR
jgi:hypothetical protein